VSDETYDAHQHNEAKKKAEHRQRGNGCPPRNMLFK
jgi:hypothetical protein